MNMLKCLGAFNRPRQSQQHSVVFAKDFASAARYVHKKPQLVSMSFKEAILPYILTDTYSVTKTLQISLLRRSKISPDYFF
jgi:hypothetical protein